MFRLWRVVSTEGPRSRGQEAVLLALPPAQSGASAGCKEAAGSGAAALVTGTRRWPEQGPRLPAAFLVAKLPIYFSSGDGRRMQRARATTARAERCGMLDNKHTHIVAAIEYGAFALLESANKTQQQ